MGIINIDYNDKFNKPIALALGYFDSIHLGHLRLIDAVKSSGHSPFVFTFTNNPAEYIGGDRGQVFTFSERLSRLSQLGVEGAISAKFDNDFMRVSGEKFLDGLISRFDLKYIVVGSDYTCGVGGSMGARAVIDYMEERNIGGEIVDLMMREGQKLSSSTVRKYIAAGDIERINAMLPLPYSVSGSVVHGRKDGGKLLGYPTANVTFSRDKLYLKEGVYYTKILVGGRVYPALTNVGNHPTFDDYNFNIESFILDFEGNIYDEYLEIIFVKRIRDTIKFASIDMLKAQIATDVEKVRQWIK